MWCYVIWHARTIVSNKPNFSTFILMLHYKMLTVYLTWHLLSKSLLIEYSTFAIYWRKNGSAVAEHYLHTRFTNTYNSVSTKVLYILTQFCTPIKPVLIINIYLNKIYSKVYTDKHLYWNWWNLLSMVTNLQVPQNLRNFLANWRTTCFSRGTLFHGVGNS
jgi:hypothetical protein